MKWTVENAAGSEARIEARRLYPDGVNARSVTLLSTRRAIQSAERKIGRITHVRLGTARPFLSEPVTLRIAEEQQHEPAQPKSTWIHDARKAQAGEKD